VYWALCGLREADCYLLLFSAVIEWRANYNTRRPLHSSLGVGGGERVNLLYDPLWPATLTAVRAAFRNGAGFSSAIIT
jgi:hypothetical protein